MEELEIEKKELESLTGKGIPFQVKSHVKMPVKGLGRYFGRKETVEKVEAFEIKPPTLAVMDRLSLISIDLEVDDQKIAEGDNTFDLVKGHIASNADKLAEYVAIATLGEDYYVREQTISGRIREYEDKEALRNFTKFFKTWLTPQELHLIAKAVIISLNLADFIDSMRLMKGTRTAKAKKNPIELSA